MKKTVLRMIGLLGCAFSTVYTMNQNDFDMYVIKTMVLDMVEPKNDKEGIRVSPPSSPSDIMQQPAKQFKVLQNLVAEHAKQKKLDHISCNIGKPNDKNDEIFSQYGRPRTKYHLNELDGMRSDIQEYTVSVGMRKLPGAAKDSFATEFAGTLTITGRDEAMPALLHVQGNKVARKLEAEFGVSPIKVNVQKYVRFNKIS